MKFEKVTLKMVREKEYNYNSLKIISTLDIVKLVNQYEDIANNTEENIYVVCLNTKNQILNFTEIAKGGLNFCNLDMKAIFKSVLLCNASKFILIHNHPSGDSTPSREDYKTTEKIKGASKLLDIQFLDHIVIAENSYSSCF